MVPIVRPTLKGIFHNRIATSIVKIPRERVLFVQYPCVYCLLAHHKIDTRSMIIVNDDLGAVTALYPMSPANCDENGLTLTQIYFEGLAIA